MFLKAFSYKNYAGICFFLIFFIESNLLFDYILFVFFYFFIIYHKFFVK